MTRSQSNVRLKLLERLGLHRIQRKVQFGMAAFVGSIILICLSVAPRLQAIDSSADTIEDKRVPSAIMIARISSEANTAVANMNRFVLLGNPELDDARKTNWELISELQKQYNGIAHTTQRNIDDRIEMNAALDALRAFQDETASMVQHGQVATPLAVSAIREKAGPFIERVNAILKGDARQSNGMVAYVMSSMARDAMVINDQIHALQFALQVTAVVVIVLIGLGTWLLDRNVIMPLRGMTFAMREVAAKNYGVAIPALGKKDELGDMAEALSVFRDGLANSDRLEEEARVVRDREKSRQSLIADSIARFECTAEGVVLTISSAATELESAANSLAHSAQEATAEATNVVTTAQSATANINSLASAGEELNTTASEIARQLGAATAATHSAIRQMRATDADVKALAETADKIGAVVDLISKLASQTNLLALNATIEAARAGEAGRGFAVVASEVKGLAAQTAQATIEIGAIVQDIRSVTQRTVQAIGDVDSAIVTIEHATIQISGTVAQQEKATREIAVNVQEAARGSSEISHAIVHVSTGASDTAAASSQVLSAASDLARQAEMMRREVATFLDTVRAA